MSSSSTLLVLAERIGEEGGMERYLDVVLGALRRRGERVVVLARTGSVDDDAQTRIVRWSDEHDAPDAAAAAIVRDAIAELNPAAVIMHNVLDGGVVAAARSARRTVYQVHDHRPFCPNGDRVYPRTGRRCATPLGAGCLVHALSDGCMYGPRPQSFTLLRRREALRDAIAASDVVIANSPAVAARAAASGVAGAVPIALPLPDDAYGGEPIPSDGSLVFVGRIQPQKGLRALVRALGMLPAATRPVLRAVGEGPDLDVCRADARQLGVRLDVLGRRDARGVREAIDRASALVLPSLWDEPFGYVGIEAFARGRPVVAFDVGGVSWWLRDGRNGLLVPAGDEAALAAALARLPEHAAELGANARADAEAYREAAIVDTLHRYYAAP